LLLAGLALAGVAGRAAEPNDLRFDGVPTQGALLRGTVPPGTKLWLRGKPLRVDPDGAFAIGFGRDETGPIALEVAPLDGPRRVETLTVAKRDWPIQRIDGLPPGQVSPNTAALERIHAEQRKLDAARAADSAEAGWRVAFQWPATGPISGVYGSQRILNGEPRAPHVGLDIAAPEGAPISAPASGVVRLAEPDLFFTGGTVIVDHGHGVMTFYAHMSRIDVQVGQHLAAGAPIGRVGKTGRVTGPHLHFALYWLGVALDPASILPPEQPKP
jgi:murein DD-endopeptidase MepM/ murein hydrolase activator NlpD